MTLERLKEYKSIKEEVSGLEDRLEELRIKAEGVGAIDTGKPAVKGSKGNATEETRIAYLSLMETYRAKVNKLVREQMKIEEAIERLPSKDRSIMRRRYIDGELLENIAVEEGYSERQIIRRIQISLVNMRKR